MNSVKIGAEEAILLLLRLVNGLQLVVYFTICVKLGIRAQHVTLLDSRVFSESHRGEGRRA
jgi:hypothetical protein